MRRWMMLVVVLASACGPSADEPTTTTTTTLPPTDATYARPTEPSTTSTTMLTTFGTTATTLGSTTTIIDAPEPAAGVPTLPDGRPTTWIGVTSDYVAVEVTTASGARVHEFGQTGTREEVDSANEAGPNVITAAWRLRDGSMVGFVECCEPAGGVIYYRESRGTISSQAQPSSDGWTLAASPTSSEFARLGYLVGVFSPQVPDSERQLFFVDEPHLGFPSGQIAWSPDGATIYWIGIEFDTGVTTLNKADLFADAPVPEAIGTLDFVGPDQFLGNIATQASGNLVGFLHTQGDGTVTASQGVVFNPAGELLVTFPIEVGSLLGSYDASGKYLIYVDGDGIVRWLGGGDSGELGAGYIHASW